MNSVFLNIILQMTESIICFSFFEAFCSNKKTKFVRLILIIISYLIMSGFNILFDYNATVNATALIVFQFLFSFLVYKQKILRSVFFSITFTLMVAVTEIIASAIIISSTNGTAIDFTTETHRYVLLILISKTLLLILSKTVLLIMNKFKSTFDSSNLIFFIYPISLLVILVIFHRVLYVYNISQDDQVLITISSFLLLVSVITINIAQIQSEQKKQELFELKAEKQKQDLDNTYFELLEHQNKELQIFVHDTKNHLSNIYNLSNDSDKAKEYINNIVKDIEQSNRFGKTSNKLLDLIIEKYSYICEKENVELKQNIHKSNLEFIADSDLTSIFNNLLDNAIEAAKQSKEKYIELSINQFESMLVIDVTNSCDTKPVVKANKLISTKKDSGLHGIGFKSICKSAKKYGGDVEWDYDVINKIFNVSIIFNV